MEPPHPPEDESPYGEGGGFVPYTPGPTPDELRERAAEEAEDAAIGASAETDAQADVEADPERPAVPQVPLAPPSPYVPYGEPMQVEVVTPTPYVGPSATRTGQAPLDGVSVAAGTAGLVGCVPIGVVLGGFGLARTKGGLRRGRGWAVTGIVASVLWFFVYLAVSAAGDFFEALPDLPVVDDDLPANELVDGQCLSGAGLNTEDDTVDNLHEVPCDEPHDGQVLAVNVLDDDEAASYEFEDDGQVGDHCDPHLTNAERDLVADTDRYFLIALTESAVPDAGDHVACIVILANGDDLLEPLP